MEQGETGTKKINQWTRYVTVVLALLQSTGLVFLFHNPDASGFADVFPQGTFTGANVAFIVLIMTAGTALIMAGRADHATGRRQRHVDPDLHERDLTLPAEGNAILQQGGPGKFIAILSIGLASSWRDLRDQGQRRVPVQYAKRVVGRR